MLSFDGWSVGIAYCLKISMDIIFCIYFIFKAKKNNIRLLYFPAIGMLAMAIGYLPFVADFFHIILTGENIQFTDLAILLYTMSLGIGGIAIIILGSSLTFSKYKKILIMIYVIFDIFLLISGFYVPHFGYSLSYPSSPGENLIKPYYTVNSMSFLGLLPHSIILITFAFNLFLKSLKLKGKLSTKYQFLSVGFIASWIWGYLVLVTQGDFIYAIVFLVCGYLAWIPLYFGLIPIKEKKTKKVKAPSETELKFVSYLTKKPLSPESIEGEYLSTISLNQDILLFMSYATKDADLFKVKEIAEKLTKSAEIKDVLYWQEDMEDNIFEYMNDNLGRCHGMILFCSKAALKSVPVKKEWTAAEAAGLPIIPVFYDINHIPTLLKSRLGVEFDFYDINRNVLELHSLILKKCCNFD